MENTPYYFYDLDLLNSTLDAVENCPYACSYCTIQTFYDDNIVFHKNLRQKLAQLELEPDRFYHIGTGQASDALAWGNHLGLLDDLCDFARANSQILLEFKTKSANIDYFTKHPAPANIVCSWTLNPEVIVANEEHLTANLSERLKAARQAADGCQRKHGVK